MWLLGSSGAESRSRGRFIGDRQRIMRNERAGALLARDIFPGKSPGLRRVIGARMRGYTLGRSLRFVHVHVKRLRLQPQQLTRFKQKDVDSDWYLFFFEYPDSQDLGNEEKEREREKGITPGVPKW